MNLSTRMVHNQGVSQEARQHGAETRPARGRPRKRPREEQLLSASAKDASPSGHAYTLRSNPTLHNAAAERIHRLQSAHQLQPTRRVLERSPEQLPAFSSMRQPAQEPSRTCSPSYLSSSVQTAQQSMTGQEDIYIRQGRQTAPMQSFSPMTPPGREYISSSSDDSSDSDTSSAFSSDESSKITAQRFERPRNRYRKAPIAMPTFQIDQNIMYFLNDMKSYLTMFSADLTESEQTQLVVTCIKGEARDIIAGYSRKQLSKPKYLFKALRKDFKKREQHVDSLHQLRQGQQEKVSVFVGRIRHHVSHLGLRHKYVDRTCLRYLRLGALQYIQNRLIQRDPKKFSKAIKLAIEAEIEGVKGKTKDRQTDSINTIQVASKQEIVNQQIADLNVIVREMKELQEKEHNRTPPQPQPQYNHYSRSQQQHNNSYKAQRAGNGIKGTCYFCHVPGHGFRTCRKATSGDKERIEERIDKYKEQKSHHYRRTPSHHALNSEVADRNPQESRQ